MIYKTLLKNHQKNIMFDGCKIRCFYVEKITKRIVCNSIFNYRKSSLCTKLIFDDYGIFKIIY